MRQAAENRGGARISGCQTTRIDQQKSFATPLQLTKNEALPTQVSESSRLRRKIIHADVFNNLGRVIFAYSLRRLKPNAPDPTDTSLIQRPSSNAPDPTDTSIYLVTGKIKATDASLKACHY